MELDDQLRHYFGTSDLSTLEPGALAAGIERMQVDLGLTKDRGQRFAIWSILHMLGAAPDLEAVFKDPNERYAARNFMDLARRAEEQ